MVLFCFFDLLNKNLFEEVVRGYINEYSETSNELFVNSMGANEIEYYINRF